MTSLLPNIIKLDNLFGAFGLDPFLNLVKLLSVEGDGCFKRDYFVGRPFFYDGRTAEGGGEVA